MHGFLHPAMPCAGGRFLAARVIVGTFLFSIMIFGRCDALESDGSESSPLAAVSVFPAKPWRADEAEAASWQGPFAMALRVMLDAGFPDPAGLAYHRIGIVTGNPWTGDSGITATEGWLLTAPESQVLFAIAWNGLVYPVVEDHGPADLEATVETLSRDRGDEHTGWPDGGEATGVDPKSLRPVHGLYLTRLGFPEAAESLLARRDLRPKMPPLAGELALVWLWNLYDRAVCAHMRGDPNMVLATSATAAAAIPALRETLTAVDPMFGDPGHWERNIDLLRRESERRLAAGKTGILDEQAFVASSPDVAGLIDALDRLQLPQNGQPGDIPWWDSPVLKALAANGHEAAGPLIECLENDARLTQSVHFWRSHHKSRTLTGVHEAALHALQDILGRGFFEPASTGDSLSARASQHRRNLAATVRAEWETYGRLTGVERTFAVLADDRATAAAWVDATALLFHRIEYDEETGEPLPPRGPAPGEVLRGREDPSVSDLIEKRIDDCGRLAAAGDGDAVRDQIELMAILTDWEPARGHATIARHVPGWINHKVWQAGHAANVRRLIDGYWPEAARDAEGTELARKLSEGVRGTDGDDF